MFICAEEALNQGVILLYLRSTDRKSAKCTCEIPKSLPSGKCCSIIFVLIIPPLLTFDFYDITAIFAVYNCSRTVYIHSDIAGHIKIERIFLSLNGNSA